LANPAKYLREADTLVKDSLVKYPQGSLFQVMGSHCARKQCNVEEGIQYMISAIDNCHALGNAPLIYKYELANCYTMKLMWSTAAEHFEPLVNEEKFQVRALCALQLATCYIMMGQKDKANATLARIPSIAKKNSSVDPIVIRQAARFQSNGAHFSAFELLFIRRDLAKMDPIMPEALALLEAQAANTNALKPIVVDASKNKGFAGLAKTFSGIGLGSKKPEVVDHSADDRAVYLMLKGAMLKSTGKGDEAIECFREVISLDSVMKEKYFVAYSLYEMAEALYHKGNIREAQEAIKKCNNCSGYDWEDPLKVRLRVTMDQLKKGGVLQDDEETVDGAEVVKSASTSSLSSSSSSSSSTTSTTTPVPDEVPAS
jgi:tetratricopeptide (TPR) repeat protein